MHVRKGKATAKAYPYEDKETGRIHDAPSFTIALGGREAAALRQDQ